MSAPLKTVDALSRNHLEMLSVTTQTLCPNLSRLYRIRMNGIEIPEADKKPKKQKMKKGLRNNRELEKKAMSMEKNDDLSPTLSCPFCHSTYLPEGCHVWLQPKMKRTPKINKILQRYTANSDSLSKFHRTLLAKYIDSTNRLAYTCLTCKKTVKFPGQRRSQQLSQIQTAEQTEVITAKVETKTKKEIMKEKKKAKKKKKRNAKEQNAGLTITKTSGVVSSSPGIKSEKDVKTDCKETAAGQVVSRHSSQQQTLSPNQHQQTKGAKLSDIKAKDLPVNKKQLVLSLDKKTILGKKHKLVSQNPVDKKRKGKDMHQQLGKLLKKDRREQNSTEGSLADFLSGL